MQAQLGPAAREPEAGWLGWALWTRRAVGGNAVLATRLAVGGHDGHDRAPLPGAVDRSEADPTAGPVRAADEPRAAAPMLLEADRLTGERLDAVDERPRGAAAGDPGVDRRRRQAIGVAGAHQRRGAGQRCDPPASGRGMFDDEEGRLLAGDVEGQRMSGPEWSAWRR